MFAFTSNQIFLHLCQWHISGIEDGGGVINIQIRQIGDSFLNLCKKINKKNLATARQKKNQSKKTFFEMCFCRNFFKTLKKLAKDYKAYIKFQVQKKTKSSTGENPFQSLTPGLSAVEIYIYVTYASSSCFCISINIIVCVKK